jgi:predicted phage tail protein
MTLRRVHLHGALGAEFGESYRFDVATASEALRALNANFPGKFVKALQGNSYRAVRGDEMRGVDMDIEMIRELRLGENDLHFIPVAEGSISQTTKGTTKIVLGAALVGGAIFLSGGTLAAPLSVAGMSVPGLSYGTVALIGLGLAIAGVSTLLAKPATQTASNDVSVAGAAQGQTGEQGRAIPLIYGEVLAPGIPISVGSLVEDIPVYANSAGSVEAAFGHNPSYWSGQ